MDKATCCYLDLPASETEEEALEKLAAAEREGRDVSCNALAEWGIYHHPYGPDDNTLACTDHVGVLLTDAPEHRVFPFSAASA